MTTYNNLEIAQVSLTFSGEFDPSISTRTFDLSTLSFLPNVPIIDQIEVERIFDTGYDTKFGDNVFTISDRRQIFILPKAWYSVNEQTKILTVVNLSTIPTYTTNGLYYPNSRTFVLETPDSNGNPQTLDIPNFLVNNAGTNDNGVVRQPDTVVIRRKTLSIDSIVTFAPGTRLTTTQLNLQFNQLKYIIQELVAKVRNEIILKFDENAVDGPFLGGSDLKMSNNYIKDLNSLSIGEVNEQFSTGIGNGQISGATYATNVGAVYDALTKGTVRRTTMNGGSATPFSGHFTATPVGDTAKRITLMADAVDATDAATLGQVRNATNIITGTLTNAVLSNIPLSKLSNVSGQGYTLPVDALANSGATAGSYGVSTAGNTNNMVYMTVDAKGRVTTIASRNMAAEDLPTSGVTANTYGQSSANNNNNMLQLIVDSKGRITGATQRSLGNNDLPTSGVTAATYGAASGTGTNTLTRFTVDNKGVITSAAHRSIEVNDLPATSVTGAGSYGQATAGNTNNMLQVTYDTKGRVTSIIHRNMGTNDLPSNIPLSKLNATNDGYTLPSSAIADASVTLAKINFGAGGTIPSANLPTIDLANINPANRGSFVLPTDSIPNIVTAASYNTQPVKDITIDAKGRVTSVSERGITDGDIPALSAGKITSGVFADALIPAPATAPTAGSYGSASNIPVITVDAKGRINTISTVTHAVANITDYTTATDTRIDNRALSRGTTSTYDAGSRKIINLAEPTTASDAVTKNYTDSTFQTSAGLVGAVTPTIQSNAIYWDSGNSVFTATRSAQNQKISGVADPTVSNQAATKNYVDTQLTNYQTTAGLTGAVTPTIQNNAVYWDSGSSVFTAARSSTAQKIRGVAAPTDSSDAVPLSYLNANALVVSGGVISAASAPITNMTMRAAGSVTANDAVNYGFIENLVLTPGTTLIGSTTPQIYRDAWSGLSKTSGHLTGFDRYQRTFTDLGAVASTMVLLEADAVTKTFVPYSVAATNGTVHDGYFWLDTSGGANKVLNVWLTTGSTPSGNLVTRNFGLSRLVSGALATTSSTGLVSIASGNDGGIAVDGNGSISLKQATTTQIGGIKQGTGLTITSGVAAVNLTDSTNTTSSSTAASATSVNTLRQASMLLDGSQVMTGRLRTAAATASLSSFNIPTTTTGPSSPVACDIWNLNHVLQVRTDVATKQIAYRDAATTSSTGLVSVVSGNDGCISVTGAGAISLSQATASQIGGIKQGTGLTITSGVASVNLSDAVNSASTSTAASSQAVKTTYDYAVGVNNSLSTTNTNLSNLSSTVTSVQTTANNALARSGGTMTGLVTLATSSSTVTPLRFIGGSAPTTPADGAVWYESGTLKFQTSAGTKTLAFTDSSLTGSAATANALTTARSIALGGDLSGSANFDGSAGITINATIQPNSVALGTDTTGNYVATVAAGTGITVTGSGVENAGITITNSDTGSAQNIFKTVTAGGTGVTAASNNANLTLNAGAGISITGNDTTKTVTITNTTTPPNVFGTVAVAGTNLVADSSTDTLTINQGSGITLTSDAGTDTFTIANAGVTGLTGTTNQVNVSASTGSVTLSLPQAIHTAATPTFGSVTAQNLTLGSSNNTIISTNTNGNINLDPNGTGIVNIQSPLDVDGTLNVDGATTLVGDVTINSPSTLTLLNSEGKISLGAASSTTSINRQVSTVAPATSGDLVLRVPTSGKAWLVANNTINTAPVAGNEIVTQAALTTALSPYVTTASLGTYMAITGNLTTGADNQVLGTGAAATGSFIVKTANIDRLTINAAGSTSIANGLGVTGNTILNNNLTVTGTSTLTGNVTCSGTLGVTGNATHSGIVSSNAATRAHITSLGNEYLTKEQTMLSVANDQFYKTVTGQFAPYSSGGGAGIVYLGKGVAPGGSVMLANGIPYWFHGHNGTSSGARYVYLHIPANAVIYYVGYFGTGFTPEAVITSKVPITRKNFTIPLAADTNDTTSDSILTNSAPTPFTVSASAQDILIATTGANDTWAFGFVRVK